MAMYPPPEDPNPAPTGYGASLLRPVEGLGQASPPPPVSAPAQTPRVPFVLPPKPAPTPENLQKFAVNEAVKRNIDPALILGQMDQESTNKPGAVSGKGARGPMQLMPDTARRLGVKNIDDPFENIAGGVKEMDRLLTKTGNVDDALRGYIAGEGDIEASKHWSPNSDTQQYGAKIQAKKDLYAPKILPYLQTTQAPPGVTPVSAPSQANGQAPPDPRILNAPPGMGQQAKQATELPLPTGEMPSLPSQNWVKQGVGREGPATTPIQPEPLPAGPGDMSDPNSRPYIPPVQASETPLQTGRGTPVEAALTDARVGRDLTDQRPGPLQNAVAQAINQNRANQGPRVTSTFTPGGLANKPLPGEGSALAEPSKEAVEAHAASQNAAPVQAPSAVTVNLGDLKEPPTRGELSKRIAQEMHFTPEEAQAYQKESGHNPFYSDVPDEKAAMASVYNRRDPDSGQVAIPFTHAASQQSAQDWLKTYRAGKAAEKVQEYLDGLKAMPDDKKREARAQIASSRPVTPEESAALETEKEREGGLGLKVGEGMANIEAGAMKGAGELTAGIGKAMDSDIVKALVPNLTSSESTSVPHQLGKLLKWAGENTSSDMNYLSRRYGLPGKTGEEIKEFSSMAPELAVGAVGGGPVGVGAAVGARQYGAGAPASQAALQGALTALTLKLGSVFSKTILTPNVIRGLESSTPEELATLEREAMSGQATQEGMAARLKNAIRVSESVKGVTPSAGEVGVTSGVGKLGEAAVKAGSFIAPQLVIPPLVSGQKPDLKNMGLAALMTLAMVGAGEGTPESPFGAERPVEASEGPREPLEPEGKPSAPGGIGGQTVPKIPGFATDVKVGPDVPEVETAKPLGRDTGFKPSSQRPDVTPSEGETAETRVPSKPLGRDPNFKPSSQLADRPDLPTAEEISQAGKPKGGLDQKIAAVREAAADDSKPRIVQVIPRGEALPTQAEMDQLRKQGVLFTDLNREGVVMHPAYIKAADIRGEVRDAIKEANAGNPGKLDALTGTVPRGTPVEPTPVPEKKETIQSQLTALRAGTKPAVLLTPGEETPGLLKSLGGEGFKIKRVSGGTLIASPTAKMADVEAADKAGTLGEMLGHVAPKPAAGEPSVTVVARDAEKRHEIQASVVPPEKAEEQKAAYAKMYPGAKISEEKPEGVIAERVEPQKAERLYDMGARLRGKQPWSGSLKEQNASVHELAANLGYSGYDEVAQAAIDQFQSGQKDKVITEPKQKLKSGMLAEKPAEVAPKAEVKPASIPTESKAVVKQVTPRVESGQAATDYYAEHGPGPKGTRGVSVNLTDARRVMSPEARTPEGMQEHGESLTPLAHQVLDQVWDKGLADPHIKTTALILGPTGSGKSTFAKPEREQMFLESHGESADRLDDKIQRALDAGKPPAVIGIYRPPAHAMRSVIERFRGEGEDTSQKGKVVSLDRSTDTYGASDEYNRLKAKWGDRIPFLYLDNQVEGQAPKAKQAAEMPTIAPSKARAELAKEIDAAHERGELTDVEHGLFGGGTSASRSGAAPAEEAGQAPKEEKEATEKTIERGPEGQRGLAHEGIDAAAHEAAPSPHNDLPEPTEGQKEAGNYQKGHIKIDGLDISVEIPAGGIRSGVDKNGERWSVEMKSHYGYIRSITDKNGEYFATKGADKEHIDVFVKPGTPEDYAGPVFSVNQTDHNGRFDEHKLMLGWPDKESAKQGYLENYQKGWKRGEDVTEFPNTEALKQWLETGNLRKKAVERRAMAGESPTGVERRGKVVSESPARETGVEGALARERRERRKVEEEAAIDARTGLQSKNQWIKAEPRINADPTREVVALDVNDLKKFNDKYGHAVGDEYLGHVGKVVLAEAKKLGISPREAFSAGGDEINVAAPIGKGADLVQGIKAGVAKFKHEDVTGSIAGGVGKTSTEADKALYADKAAMKNRGAVKIGEGAPGAVVPASARASTIKNKGDLAKAFESVWGLKPQEAEDVSVVADHLADVFVENGGGTKEDFFGKFDIAGPGPGGNVLEKLMQRSRPNPEEAARLIKALVKRYGTEKEVSPDGTNAYWLLPDGRVVDTGDQRHDQLASRAFKDAGLTFKSQTTEDPVPDFARRTGAIRLYMNEDALSVDAHTVPSESQMRAIAGAARYRKVGVQTWDYHDATGKIQYGSGLSDFQRAIDASRASLFQTAFHGSPYVFPKFTMDHIGSGEGAQAYGWGLYFAGARQVAEFYRHKLADSVSVYIDGKKFDYISGPAMAAHSPSLASFFLTQMPDQSPDSAIAELRDVGKRRGMESQYEAAAKWLDENRDRVKVKLSGALYKVDLRPKEDEYLDWDKRFSEQSALVQASLKKAVGDHPKLASRLTGMYHGEVAEDERGSSLYSFLSGALGAKKTFGKGDLQWSADVPSDRKASEYLLSLGIRGIKYLDQGSRPEGRGTRNYVIFDASDIEIQQALAQGVKGSTEFLDDMRAVIRGFENADVTTALHEIFHATLPLFMRLAQQVPPESKLVNQMKAIGSWLRVEPDEFLRLHELWKRNKGTEEEQATYRDAQETGAKGWERYFYDGVVPKPELEAAFGRLKTFFRGVYGDIMPSIPAEIQKGFAEWLGAKAADVEVPEARGPPEKTAAAKKEPWEMTRQEYVASVNDSLIANWPGGGKVPEGELAKASHRYDEIIREARKAGKVKAAKPAVAEKAPPGGWEESDKVLAKIPEPAWWKNATGARRSDILRAFGFKNAAAKTRWHYLTAEEQHALDNQWGSPAWKMTNVEYARTQSPALAGQINTFQVSYAAQHEKEIKAAMARGETIPDRVLADYPKLKAQAVPETQEPKASEESAEEPKTTGKKPAEEQPSLFGGAEEAESADLVPGTRELIATLRDRLASGGRIADNPELTRLANEAFKGSRAKGTFDPRDMYDALEVAVNQVLGAQGRALMEGDPKESLGKIRELMSRLPTQALRSDEQEKYQQFSTPPTLSFVAAKALDLQPGDIVLEPSAGTADLVVFPKAMGAKVYANEITPRRKALLEEQGYETTGVNAQYLNSLLPKNIRPTAIVMNPPFSATGGIAASNKNKYGFQHVDEALTRLVTGGRAVIILGRGAGFSFSSNRDWWAKVMDKYNVRANISLPGKEYAKYGTSFDNQLIIIDKIGPTPGNNLAEKIGGVQKNTVESLEGAIDAINSIAKDRKPVVAGAVPPAVDQPTSGVRRPAGTRPGGQTNVGGGGNGGAGTGPRPQPGGPGTGPQASDQGLPGGQSSTRPVGARQPREPEQERPIQPSSGTTPEVRQESGVTYGKNLAAAARQTEAGGTFVAYVPAKLTGGVDHPGEIVEAASMAAVDPPDIHYTPNLPASTINQGKISNAQLESVVYAGQRHQQHLPDGRTAGYFIGDGTGVGKGREIAAIIFDNWNQGNRKSVWISVSDDLAEAAKIDFEGVGAGHIPLYSLGKWKPADKIGVEHGVLFVTYSRLIRGTMLAGGIERTRLDQIKEWLGPDSVIAFDESHKAKNLVTTLGKPTHTGRAVAKLQDDAPGARVVYASATGATEVRNMGYMTRLGIWGPGTPFADFARFEAEIEAGGVGVMEAIARDMKSLGMYTSRSLSYNGVEYKETIHELTGKQRKIYDTAAELWQVVLQNIDEALGLTNADSKAKLMALSQFWSGQQRFFKSILTSMKVPTAIKETDDALARGNSVIISLIGTNEARAEGLVTKAKAAGEDLADLDFSPREAIATLIDKSFPTVQYQDVQDPSDPTKNIKVPLLDAAGNVVHNQEALEAKERLLDRISDIDIPEHYLDQLVNHYGVDKVAELTGRDKRLIRDTQTGKVEYQKRAPKGVSMDKASLHEMANFQEGRKRIAIISQSASTGISLHADKSRKNQQRRTQITLELSWSADSQMQTFGRSHRSNQVQPPEFVLLSTDAGGEKRFSSTIARRLASLGALTKGQRDATGGGDLAKYNFETVEGRAAVNLLYRNILAGRPVEGLADPVDVLLDMGIAKEKDGVISIDPKDETHVPRFMNRLLALDIDRQNALFDHFTRTFDGIVQRSKETGTFDDGVADLKGDSIKVEGEPTVIAKDQTTGAETKHYVLNVENPMPSVPFESVSARFGGFYKQKRSGAVVYAQKGGNRTDPDSGETYGTQVLTTPAKERSNTMREDEFREKYDEISSSTAEPLWRKKFNELPLTQTEQVHVIAGAILPLWDQLKGQRQGALKVIRAMTDDGERVVGVHIPAGEVGRVTGNVGAGAQPIPQSPDLIYQMVMRGGSVPLRAGMSLRRSSLAGEPVVEVFGIESNRFSEMRDLGLHNEKINYKQRFFIPTDEDEGPQVLGRLLDRYPATVTSPSLNQLAPKQTETDPNDPRLLFQHGPEFGGLSQAARNYLDSLSTEELRKAVAQKHMSENYQGYARHRLESLGLDVNVREKSEEEERAERSLASFLKSKGGIKREKETKGETDWAQESIKMPGLVNDKTGKSADYLASLANQEGYRNFDYEEIEGEHELLELLGAESRGEVIPNIGRSYDDQIDAQFAEWEKEGLSPEEAENVDIFKDLQANNPKWIELGNKLGDPNAEPTDRDITRFRALSAEAGLPDDAIDQFIADAERKRASTLKPEPGDLFSYQDMEDGGNEENGGTSEGPEEAGQNEAGDGERPIGDVTYPEGEYTYRMLPKLDPGAKDINENEHFNWGRLTFSHPSIEEAARIMTKNAVLRAQERAAAEGTRYHKTVVSRDEMLKRAEDAFGDEFGGEKTELLKEVAETLKTWKPGDSAPSIEAEQVMRLIAAAAKKRAADLMAKLENATDENGFPFSEEEYRQIGIQADRALHDATEIASRLMGLRSEAGRRLSMWAINAHDRTSLDSVLGELRSAARKIGLPEDGQTYRGLQSQVSRLALQLDAKDELLGEQKEYIDELQHGNRERAPRPRKETIEDKIQADLDRQAEAARARIAELLKPRPLHQMAPKQTDTPAFRKWFGDSKVVDEKGEPLVVYHGTGADFEKFKIGDEGIFFTAGKGIASKYAGFAADEGAANVIPAYLSILHPLSISPGEYLSGETDSGLNLGLGGLDISGLGKRGFDGILMRADADLDPLWAADTWIAFRPEQIKSATGNRGTFDPKSPNILYQPDPELVAGLAVVMASQLRRMTQPELEDYMAKEFGDHFTENRDDVVRLAVESYRESARRIRLEHAKTVDENRAKTALASLGAAIDAADRAAKLADAQLEKVRNQTAKAWAAEDAKTQKERERVAQANIPKIDEARKQAEIDRLFEAKKNAEQKAAAEEAARSLQIQQETDEQIANYEASLEGPTAAEVAARKALADDLSDSAKESLKMLKQIEEARLRDIADAARARLKQARADARQAEKEIEQATAQQRKIQKEREAAAKKWDYGIRVNGEAAAIRLTDPTYYYIRPNVPNPAAIDDLAAVLAAKTQDPNTTDKDIASEMKGFGPIYIDNAAEIRQKASALVLPAKEAARQAELGRRATTEPAKWQVTDKAGNVLWVGSARNGADAKAKANNPAAVDAKIIQKAQSHAGALDPAQLQQTIDQYKQTLKDRAAIRRQIDKILLNMKMTWGDYVAQYVRATYLWAPHTFLSAGLKHLALNAAEELSTIPRGFWDTMIASKAGTDRHFSNASLGDMLSAGKQALGARTWGEIRDIIKKGHVDDKEDVFSKFTEHASPFTIRDAAYSAKNPVLNTGAKMLNWYINVPLRSHGAMYHSLKVYALSRALWDIADVAASSEVNEMLKQNLVQAGPPAAAKRAELKAKYYDQPTPAMVTVAIQAASESTLLNDNEITKFLGKAESALGKVPVVGGALKVGMTAQIPFKRIPVNATQMMLNYLPSNIFYQPVKAMVQIGKIKKDMLDRGAGGAGNGGEPPDIGADAFREWAEGPQGRAFVQQMGRATTGAVIMAIGFILAKMFAHAIASSMDDPEKRNRVYLPLFGWVELDRLTPLGNLFILGVTMAKIFDHPTSAESSIKWGLAKAFGKYFSESPYLKLTEHASTINDLINGKGFDFKRSGAYQVSSLMPFGGAWRDVATTTDKWERNPFSFTEHIEENIPGLRNRLEKKLGPDLNPIRQNSSLDMFGHRRANEPVVNRSEALKAATSMLFHRSDEIPTEEKLRLSYTEKVVLKALRDNGGLPSRLPKDLHDQFDSMTHTMQVQLVRQSNQTPLESTFSRLQYPDALKDVEIMEKHPEQTTAKERDSIYRELYKKALNFQKKLPDDQRKAFKMPPATPPPQ